MHFHQHRHGPHFEGLRHHFGRFGRGFHRGPDFGAAFEEEGGRRRKMFDAAELRLVLLKLLKEQPRHGYDLIRAIEELTAGAYSPSPGVVYPTLTLLSDMGHTSERDAGGSRKTYALTPEGEAFLAERAAQADALFARLAEMAAERERGDHMPVRRAMKNLRTVLLHRLADGEAKPQLVHAITAILDEAAQKIERL
jgi:DNA-binding PadR family transcriptional regulator